MKKKNQANQTNPRNKTLHTSSRFYGQNKKKLIQACKTA
jgi:hypothetical protein